MNEYIELLKTFGLPTAMCFWFMIRTEKVIVNNTRAMQQFLTTAEKCKK